MGNTLATAKTEVSELATAFGITYGRLSPIRLWREELRIPGIPDAQVRVQVALLNWNKGDDIYDVFNLALENGNLFRKKILRDESPSKIAWTGSKKCKHRRWLPDDLVVNDEVLISVKFDSTTWFNLSPEALFVDLLQEETYEAADDWYSIIAPQEYKAFFQVVLRCLHSEGKATTIRSAKPQDMNKNDKRHLKEAIATWGKNLPEPAAEAYERFCEVISQKSLECWGINLLGAGPQAATNMFLRLIRIAEKPYWLLGASNGIPLRYRISSVEEWESYWCLEEFEVRYYPTGQPRVDWAAQIEKIESQCSTVVEGFCEIRWSRGKFQRPPECKVHIKTSPGEIPGYEPF